MDALYAGTATLLEAPLADALPPGEYCAELSLTDSATGAHDATKCLTFWVGQPQSNDGAGPDSLTPRILPGTSALLAVAPQPVHPHRLGIDRIGAAAGRAATRTEAEGSARG